MAFAKKETPWAPVCHGCGRRCPGGWRKCQHITEEHRQKVEELDAAGAFKRGGGGGGASKRGTINTAAGAEEDDATKEESGEDEDDGSKLTSATGPLPTYRELLELTGHISANVGRAAGANNKKCTDEDSWDGDDLADLGVGFLEIDGATSEPALQDQGVALAIKEDWQIQGRKGSNPLRRSPKSKTPSQLPNKRVGHHPQEKLTWVSKSTGTATAKEEKIQECLREHSRTNVRSAKPSIKTAKVKKQGSKGYPQAKNTRYTLDWWKCYLDSCASYHTFFVKEFLRDISEGSSTMSGSCNAGTVLLQKKGWYKNFQVWLNEKGIVNLLSIPMLEDAGYKVSTHTDRDWEVITPQGKVIVFKCDTGVCKGMPYIGLRTQHEGHLIIETVKNNIKGLPRRKWKEQSCHV